MLPETDFLPLNKNVRLLAADPCGIFALEKPAGIMTHPNAPGLAAAKSAMLVADYSLKNECYFVRDPEGKVRKIFVLNRLDSPTSGVVLCADNERVARLAREAFSGTEVKKTYFALVLGAFTGKTLWQDFLIKENRNGNLQVRAVPHGKLRGAQFAETAAEAARRGSHYSLVKLSPHTGRTHQLRVQCAAHNFPILGDKAYGDFSANKKMTESPFSEARSRLFLHAAYTEIAFPWKGQKTVFRAESPLPAVFEQVLGNEIAEAAAGETRIGRFSVRLRK
ncbi:MAG: RNA pseudouridine synthase [Opitutales bacterium]|nr:RNA pseudouridine synthase [Opitutales bacterium]